jgi:CDP-diacylglycerol--inositol 3-phosphatidyltransferase
MAALIPTLTCDRRSFQRVLFAICAGNELFFVSLYLMKWVQTPLGLNPMASSPILANLTYPGVMALLSFPICFTKNVINLVQLWKASKILVGVDLAARAMARDKVQEMGSPSPKDPGEVAMK